MPTVREVISSYLEVGAKHLVPESKEERVRVLNGVAGDMGDLDCSEATPFRLLQYLERQTTWKAKTTRDGRVARIVHCFTWAARMKLITKNPFKDDSGDPYAEFINESTPNNGYESTSDDDFKKFLSFCYSPRLKRFVLFLRYTGCRPIEARRLTWGQIDPKNFTVVQHIHKTSKKSNGKPRIIHITGRVADLLNAAYAEAIKRGPLNMDEYVFKTRSGKQWTRQDACGSIREVARRAGLGRTVGYGIGRVAFIERGILGNVNNKALATLVGHASTNMLDVYARRIQNYSDELIKFASIVNDTPLQKSA